ncbi:uncharacterized protein LY89DRAFT_755374 [Mollisia scopiformis]|uniref:Prolyl 4-hydroxylase alpha subunit domain-containing protein n=1 Tax=Mollisia scopiformis TaxID=149040 RepID=A0A194XTI8_MOLSC|nr:uncharacterized protein LY89DRAFT_755374 [Mollisia scopiformis]KUJ23456.1 hypothetical protein LY89DRAFT_755374 [Mollisia scopiformis]
MWIDGDACPAHTYETVVVSIDPLMIYLRDFITTSERQHLLNASRGRFQRADFSRGYEKENFDNDIRDASLVDIGDEDSVMNCIRQRAARFQGNCLDTRIEKTTIQTYAKNGHFTYHFDAFFDDIAADINGNRISTFMLYLEAPEVGGGTSFPRIAVNIDPQDKCDIIECHHTGNGTVFWPSIGNGIFWMNLNKERRLHHDTWHAGLPVLSGVKTIVNIWSWSEGALFEK